jgi:hypothetical protein
MPELPGVAFCNLTASGVAESSEGEFVSANNSDRKGFSCRAPADVNMIGTTQSFLALLKMPFNMVVNLSLLIDILTPGTIDSSG